jgi:hypothetical protein
MLGYRRTEWKGSCFGKPGFVWNLADDQHMQGVRLNPFRKKFTGGRKSWCKYANENNN